MSYIILGLQGSGKGTQADILAEKIGYAHVESGKILRAKAEKDEKIRAMLQEGAIVPDIDTLAFIESYIREHGFDVGKIIFDGYPRKVAQYHLLSDFLRKHGQKIEGVIYLSLPDEVGMARISSRVTCRKCGRVFNTVTNPSKVPGKCDDCGGELYTRDDDQPETIKKRITIYHTNTEPILDLARAGGLLIEINGDQPIEKIASDLELALKISK